MKLSLKHFRVYILMAVLIMGAYIGTAYWLERDSVREHEQDFNDEQSRQVAAAAANLETYFSGVKDTFDALALYAVPAYLRREYSLNILEQIIAATAQNIYADRSAVGFFPASDTALALYTKSYGTGPAAREQLLTWIDQHWETVRLSKTTLVTPFVTSPEYQFFGYLSPVFHPESGEFVGVLGAALDFAPVLEHEIVPLRSGQYGAAWVQNHTGLVIYDHETPIIGQNVLTISEPYPDLRRLVETMFTQDTGQDEYHYTVELGGKVARKLVAWDTVYMGSQRLTIAMSAPDTEVNAELAVSRRQMVLLGGMLGAALIVSGGLFYLSRQRTLEQLVARRTQELEQTTRELKALTGHLEQRVRERTTELSLERAQLSAILDVINEGLIYHQDGKVRYINAAFARLLGYTADEMVGSQPSLIQGKFMSSQDTFEDARRRYWQHIHTRDSRDPVWTTEIRLRRKDGSEFDAQLTSVPVNDDQGRYIGGVEIIRNITQEKALQIQKDSFITNASHELRRPLANLKTRIYLLRRQPDKLEEHLEVIERATDMMAHLVQALVDVSQLQRGEFTLDRKPISLQSALRQAVDLAQPEAAGQQVALISSLPDAPVFVYADSQWLVEGFKRLLIGIIPYTRPGGQIQVQLKTHTNGNQSGLAEVTVHGATPHLESEYLEHIFEPFARASEGDTPNTGLELSIAQHVIEAHHGQITARSDPQRGLTFTIQLVASPAPDSDRQN